MELLSRCSDGTGVALDVLLKKKPKNFALTSHTPQN